MKTICQIFKSPNDEDMYLYVVKSEGLKHVPELLLKRFGKPIPAMTLLLQPERKLARADTQKVISALEDQGYYLQMPPPKDDDMNRIHLENTKMGLAKR